MPVTARLSTKLYERLGEDVAQELVDWFNQVDATYRSDLRELNELNFVRFDAKLEQRLAELRAMLREEISDMRSTLRDEIAEVRSTLRGEMAATEGRLRGDMREVETRLVRWMFVFWTGTTVTIVGVMFALLKL